MAKLPKSMPRPKSQLVAPASLKISLGNSLPASMPASKKAKMTIDPYSKVKPRKAK